MFKLLIQDTSESEETLFIKVKCTAMIDTYIHTALVAELFRPWYTAQC